MTTPSCKRGWAEVLLQVVMHSANAVDSVAIMKEGRVDTGSHSLWPIGNLKLPFISAT